MDARRMTRQELIQKQLALVQRDAIDKLNGDMNLKMNSKNLESLKDDN